MESTYFSLTLAERYRVIQFAFLRLPEDYIIGHVLEHPVYHPLLTSCWCFKFVAQVCVDIPLNRDYFQDPNCLVNYPYVYYYGGEDLLREFSEKSLQLPLFLPSSALEAEFFSNIAEQQEHFSTFFDF